MAKGLTNDTRLCKFHSMAQISTVRRLVDEALKGRNTDLSSFVANGRAEGKSVRQVASDLQFVTGIPVAWRTLYRWLEREEVPA